MFYSGIYGEASDSRPRQIFLRHQGARPPIVDRNRMEGSRHRFEKLECSTPHWVDTKNALMWHSDSTLPRRNLDWLIGYECTWFFKTLSTSTIKDTIPYNMKSMYFTKQSLSLSNEIQYPTSTDLRLDPCCSSRYSSFRIVRFRKYIDAIFFWLVARNSGSIHPLTIVPGHDFANCFFFHLWFCLMNCISKNLKKNMCRSMSGNWMKAKGWKGLEGVEVSRGGKWWNAWTGQRGRSAWRRWNAWTGQRGRSAWRWWKWVRPTRWKCMEGWMKLWNTIQSVWALRSKYEPKRINGVQEQPAITNAREMCKKRLMTPSELSITPPELAPQIDWVEEDEIRYVVATDQVIGLEVGPPALACGENTFSATRQWFVWPHNVLYSTLRY